MQDITIIVYSCLGYFNKGKDMTAIKLNITKKKWTKLPNYTECIVSELDKWSCTFANSFAFETIIYDKRGIDEKNMNKKSLEDSLLDDASMNFLINDYERTERRNVIGDDSEYWRNFIEVEGRVNDSYGYDSANDDISSGEISYES